jgi:hypothetical protein
VSSAFCEYFVCDLNEVWENFFRWSYWDESRGAFQCSKLARAYSCPYQEHQPAECESQRPIVCGQFDGISSSKYETDFFQWAVSIMLLVIVWICC